MRKFPAILICFIFFSSISLAQTKIEGGSQSIINYLPREYGANGQNWAIAQDNRGIMYFGNELGLLEFDGITWRLYQVSNKSVIRSLAYDDDDGKLYAGASGDLGYFFPD